MQQFDSCNTTNYFWLVLTFVIDPAKDASPLAALDLILAPGDPDTIPMLASNIHRLVDDNAATGIRSLCKLLTLDDSWSMNDTRRSGERWRLLAGLEVLEVLLAPSDDTAAPSPTRATGRNRNNGIIERTGMLDYHELKVDLRSQLCRLCRHDDDQIRDQAAKIRRIYFLRVSDLPRVTELDLPSAGAERVQDPDEWNRLRTIRWIQLLLPRPEEDIPGVFTAEDLEIVIAFLRIGNFEGADDTVRQYTREELGSPCLNVILTEARAAITKYFRAVAGLVLENPAEKFAAAASNRPASPSGGEGKSCDDEDADAAASNRENCLADEMLLLNSLEALAGHKTWDFGGQDAKLFAKVSALAEVCSCACLPYPGYRACWVVRFLSPHCPSVLSLASNSYLKPFNILISFAKQSKRASMVANAEETIFSTLNRKVLARLHKGPSSATAFSTAPASKPEKDKRQKRLRQDHDGAISIDTLKCHLFSTVVGVPPRPLELVVALEYLGFLMNPFFQKAAMDLAQAHNGTFVSKYSCMPLLVVVQTC